MPARKTAPIGAPCWIDLMTSDAARARTFYSELFGWTAGEPSPEFGGYFMFTKNEAPVAGAMSSPPGYDVHDVWSIYLATDDAQKTVEIAAANGGRVLDAPTRVADLGTSAVIEGPDGARVGVWQPDTFHGLAVLGETDTPVWFELHTRAYDAATRFYREVFRMRTEVASDSREFRYTLAKDGDEDVAGFMDDTIDTPDGTPSEWAVYFSSDDVDAALANIVSLGGSIVRDADDTPYGRIATAADPMGARFRLQGPNNAPVAS